MKWRSSRDLKRCDSAGDGRHDGHEGAVRAGHDGSSTSIRWHQQDTSRSSRRDQVQPRQEGPRVAGQKAQVCVITEDGRGRALNVPVSSSSSREPRTSRPASSARHETPRMDSTDKAMFRVHPRLGLRREKADPADLLERPPKVTEESRQDARGSKAFAREARHVAAVRRGRNPHTPESVRRP